MFGKRFAEPNMLALNRVSLPFVFADVCTRDPAARKARARKGVGRIADEAKQGKPGLKNTRGVAFGAGPRRCRDGNKTEHKHMEHTPPHVSHVFMCSCVCARVSVCLVCASVCLCVGVARQDRDAAVQEVKRLRGKLRKYRESHTASGDTAQTTAAAVPAHAPRDLKGARGSAYDENV